MEVTSVLITAIYATLMEYGFIPCAELWASNLQPFWKITAQLQLVTNRNLHDSQQYSHCFLSSSLR